MTFRYGGSFQVLFFDSTFLTVKEGLLPPKYAFGIDLTYAESETKYSRSVRANLAKIYCLQEEEFSFKLF